MACGSCASRKVRETYVHTSPTGATQVYKTETEAKAAVARRGGSYRKQ